MKNFIIKKITIQKKFHKHGSAVRKMQLKQPKTVDCGAKKYYIAVRSSNKKNVSSISIVKL